MPVFHSWFSWLEVGFLVLYHFEGPTVEKIIKDDMEILVAGQGVDIVCCTCATEAEDWRDKVSDARLQQE